MNSSLSLKNKTVLVPREKSQGKAFSEMVKQFGGNPVEIPLLAFKALGVTSELQRIMDKIQQYDWIIFTSKVTIETFFSYRHNDPTRFPKIAVIGEKTAQYIKKEGFNAAFIPTKYVAETFVEEFSSEVEPGMKILIPKGNLARDFISTQLKVCGAEVDEVVVYETYFPQESKEKLRQMLSENTLDIIPFTSPSTVDHFFEVVKEYELSSNIQNCIFACIGPVAQKRAERFGLKVDIVPKVYTVENMLRMIVQFLHIKEEGKRRS